MWQVSRPQTLKALVQHFSCSGSNALRFLESFVYKDCNKPKVLQRLSGVRGHVRLLHCQTCLARGLAGVLHILLLRGSFDCSSLSPGADRVTGIRRMDLFVSPNRWPCGADENLRQTAATSSFPLPIPSSAGSLYALRASCCQAGLFWLWGSLGILGLRRVGTASYMSSGLDWTGG